MQNDVIWKIWNMTTGRRGFSLVLDTFFFTTYQKNIPQVFNYLYFIQVAKEGFLRYLNT